MHVIFIFLFLKRCSRYHRAPPSIRKRPEAFQKLEGNEWLWNMTVVPASLKHGGCFCLLWARSGCSKQWNWMRGFWKLRAQEKQRLRICIWNIYWNMGFSSGSEMSRQHRPQAARVWDSGKSPPMLSGFWKTSTASSVKLWMNTLKMAFSHFLKAINWTDSEKGMDDLTQSNCCQRKPIRFLVSDCGWIGTRFCPSAQGYFRNPVQAAPNLCIPERRSSDRRQEFRKRGSERQALRRGRKGGGPWKGLDPEFIGCLWGLFSCILLSFDILIYNMANRQCRVHILFLHSMETFYAHFDRICFPV